MKAIASEGGVIDIIAATPRTQAEIRQARFERDPLLIEQFADPFNLSAAKLADAEV